MDNLEIQIKKHKGMITQLTSSLNEIKVINEEITINDKINTEQIFLYILFFILIFNLIILFFISIVFIYYVFLNYLKFIF